MQIIRFQRLPDTIAVGDHPAGTPSLDSHRTNTEIILCQMDAPEENDIRERLRTEDRLSLAIASPIDF